MVRHYASQMLSLIGYEVIEARDGQEALQLWRRHREQIAAIVLDAIMPRTTGTHTHKEIRGDDPRIYERFRRIIFR